jgi:hypothetical protein
LGNVSRARLSSQSLSVTLVGAVAVWKSGHRRKGAAARASSGHRSTGGAPKVGTPSLSASTKQRTVCPSSTEPSQSSSTVLHASAIGWIEQGPKRPSSHD